jgi:hypothetical protein
VRVWGVLAEIRRYYGNTDSRPLYTHIVYVCMYVCVLSTLLWVNGYQDAFSIRAQDRDSVAAQAQSAMDQIKNLHTSVQFQNVDRLQSELNRTRDERTRYDVRRLRTSLWENES